MELPRVADLDNGGGALLIGLGTALGGVIEVPTMRSSSRLQKRLGLRRVYMLGCGVYALGFLLWGSVLEPDTALRAHGARRRRVQPVVHDGVVVIGRLLPPNLYATGNAVLVDGGVRDRPDLGAGIGGFIYQHLGAPVLYASASALARGARPSWPGSH